MILITKKHDKGNDGYKVFSVRLKDETVDALDRISYESNRSRNDLINFFLEFCIQHYVIDNQEIAPKK